VLGVKTTLCEIKRQIADVSIILLGQAGFSAMGSPVARRTRNWYLSH
jgi:hypothetical protein